MVRCAILFALAVAVPACAPAQEEKNASSAAQSARAIVTITTNGGRSDSISGDETAEQCTAFRLTPDQVRDYFARATTVEDRAYNHDLDMSRCYVAGTIRLPDGDGGTWAIDQARRGYLARADGSHRYMVCTDCPAPPFYE